MIAATAAPESAVSNTPGPAVLMAAMVAASASADQPQFRK